VRILDSELAGVKACVRQMPDLTAISYLARVVPLVGVQWGISLPSVKCNVYSR